MTPALRSMDEQLAAAAVGVWARAIPMVALHALWGRSEAKGVYAIAGALPPRRRAGALAWFAGLDPQPRSARAVKAATEALRGAGDDAARLGVIAMVPLKEPSVLAAARRVATGRRARRAFELRMSGAGRSEMDAFGSDLAVLRALRAVRLFEDGEREAAEAELAEAVGEPSLSSDDPMFARAVLLGVRRLGAWGALEGARWVDQPSLEGAFLAGLEGRAAVDVLLPADVGLELLAEAALGLSDAPGEWRDRLSRRSVADSEELLADGLISFEELWASRFALALVGPEPKSAVRAEVMGAIRQARGAASAFAERIEERFEGTPRDEGRVRRLEDKLAPLVASPEEKANPTWRSVRPVLLVSRSLAAAGGAREVAKAVKALEALWGPASSWVGDGFTSMREPVIELLSCAEGRALEAAQAAQACPELETAARVRLCAGLARDGHPKELGDVLPAVLREALEPEEMELLAPAVIALDGGEAARLRDRMASEIGSLPATTEAAEVRVRELDFG